MSMLTPPGMGGKYRITGTIYPRMRRPSKRRRIVLSAAAGVVVVGLLGWGTVQLVGVFGGNSSHHETAGHCGTRSTATGAATIIGTKAGTALPNVPKPSGVTVNVYNATEHTGLAKSTADELKKRGFVIGKVGNASDTYDDKVKGTAILLGGPKSQEALKVLGTQLSAGDLRTDPHRQGSTNIDLIIGSGFASLDPLTNAHHALAVLNQPVPATSPSKGCPARKQGT